MDARYEVKSARERAAKQLESDRGQLKMHQGCVAELTQSVADGERKVFELDVALAALPAAAE